MSPSRITTRATEVLERHKTVFKAIGGVLAAGAATVSILKGVGVIGGGGSDDHNIENAIRQAFTGVKDAGVADFEDSAKVNGKQFATVRGSYDFRLQQGTLTIRALGHPFANQVYDGDTVYTCFRTGREANRWVKGMRSDTSASFGSLSFVSLDPSQELAYLKGASNLRKVGEESTLGTPTTHYTGTAAVGPGLQKQIGSNVRLDAWVDTQGIARRVETSVPARGITTTLFLSGFRSRMPAIRFPTPGRRC